MLGSEIDDRITFIANDPLTEYFHYFHQQLYQFLIKYYLFTDDRASLDQHLSKIELQYTQLQLIQDQSQQILHAIESLKDHHAELMSRAAYLENQRDHLSAQLYRDRAEAITKLINDLESAYAKYFTQDFSDPAIQRDDNAARDTLHNIINKHLLITNEKLIGHARWSSKAAAEIKVGFYSFFPIFLTNRTSRLNGYTENDTVQFIIENILPAIDKAIRIIQSSTADSSLVFPYLARQTNVGPQSDLKSDDGDVNDMSKKFKSASYSQFNNL